MFKVKHTPLPWYAIDEYEGTIPIDAPPRSTGYDESIEICRVSCQEGKQEIRANAEFIVKACNMFYRLVEACEFAHMLLRTFSDSVPEDERMWTTFDHDALCALEEVLKEIEEE